MFKALTEKRKISIFLFPLTVICFLNLFLWASLFITKSIYTGKILAFTGVILIVWLPLFAKDQFRKDKDGRRTYVETNILYAGMFAILLAAYFCTIVWRSGYLSLNPVGAVNDGSQTIDTLYHSAIAESYSYSFLPSPLINDCEPVKYHSLIHFLIGLVSRVLDIPCFISFSYLYPTIFLPVYAFLQFMAVNCVRHHFRTPNMGTLQLFILFLANVGFFVQGIWVDRFVFSESFNVALSLFYLYVIVALKEIETDPKDKKKRPILILAMMALLFLMSWGKISVGFIALIGTMWYVFKMGIKKPIWWICNMGFALVFAYYNFFFQHVPSASSKGSSYEFRLFALGDDLNGRLGIFGYWLIISILSLVFIWAEMNKEKIKPKDFLTEKTIWIDIVVVCTIFAYLPGAIMVFEGANAGYFSNVMIHIAMLLLCGKDYFDIKKDVTQPMRGIIVVAAMLWCIVNSIEKLPGKPLYHVTAESATMDGFYGELINLREKVKDDRQDYIIYLESDIRSADLFVMENEHGMRAAYIYPAVTGIGVINTTYVRDGKYYSFVDNEVIKKSYSARRVNHDKLTYEEAKKRAKSLGKKHIIHVTKDDYVIEDL